MIIVFIATFPSDLCGSDFVFDNIPSTLVTQIQLHAVIVTAHIPSFLWAFQETSKGLWTITQGSTNLSQSTGREGHQLSTMKSKMSGSGNRASKIRTHPIFEETERPGSQDSQRRILVCKSFDVQSSAELAGSVPHRGHQYSDEVRHVGEEE